MNYMKSLQNTQMLYLIWRLHIGQKYQPVNTLESMNWKHSCQALKNESKDCFKAEYLNVNVHLSNTKLKI